MSGTVDDVIIRDSLKKDLSLAKLQARKKMDIKVTFSELIAVVEFA